MKKLIFALPVLTILLVSCKKDYSCSCTDTDVDDSGTEVTTYTYKVEGATKKQAQVACNEATVTYMDGADSFKTKCDLSK